MSSLDDFDQLGRLQRQLAQQSEEIRRAMNPMMSLSESIRRNQEIWRDQFRGLSGMAEWQQSISETLSGFTSTTSLMQGIEIETQQWSDLLSGFKFDVPTLDLQAISLPATIWQDSLSEITQSFDRLKLPDLYPRLTTNLIAPHQAYSSFGRSIIEQLGQGVDDHEEAALSGALLLAEEQIAGATEVTADFLDEFDQVVGTDVLTDEPVLNVFESQKVQLLRQSGVGDADAVSGLLLLSASARLNSRTRQVVQRVVQCNRAAKFAGREEIFTPTTTFIDAQSRLQWVSASSQDEMGDIVDSLYFMLYEGAGADRLRFLEYLDDSDCEVIWVIKHLRNKFYRHDPDHGSKSGQDKSWRDVAQALKSLGFSKLPTTAEGFQRMQVALLKKVDQFLEKLLDRIPGVDG